MRIYRWEGSAFAIGRQHGLTFREAIRETAAKESLRLAKGNSAKKQAAEDRLWQIHQQLCARWLPEFVQEIRGLADGAGISFGEAFAVSCSTRASVHVPDACSSLFVPPGRSASGGTLVGQNKDTGRDPDEHLFVHKIYESGRRELLLTYAGWVTNIGISSKGTGICGNSLVGGLAAEREELSPAIFWRIAHETGDLDLIARLAREYPFGGGSVLIAHANGNALVLEFLNGKVGILPVCEKAWSRANTPLTPELPRIQSPSQERSDLRQSRLDSLLGREGLFNEQNIVEVFSDHEHYPLSICRHHSLLDSNVTTGGYLADLGSGTMRVWRSQPCLGHFTIANLND